MVKNKHETTDEYFTRGSAITSVQEIEELKNSMKQMRQTLVARIERLETRIDIVEQVALPGFKTADELDSDLVGE